MKGGLRSFLKLIVPKAVRRRLFASYYARHFRNFYYGDRLRAIYSTILNTGETHNFTYDLTDVSLRYMAEIISVVTRVPATQVEGYILEAINDAELRSHLEGMMRIHGGPKSADGVRSPFGRRLGWYAVARTIKPKVLVETGVERGHGALILCAALLRNQSEGFSGRYFGTDIDPGAGWLLSGKYASVGQILYGDSITSLKALRETVDLFVNDSDHSADYEAAEYETIAPKLSKMAIILGDNAHVTDKLAVFSRGRGRHFLMFNERPKDHWYPGGGIGISFLMPRSTSNS